MDRNHPYPNIGNVAQGKSTVFMKPENETIFYFIKRLGAGEACSAHNRKDLGSKPRAAIIGCANSKTHNYLI